VVYVDRDHGYRDCDHYRGYDHHNDDHSRRHSPRRH
jgi:hypothetical protein